MAANLVPDSGARFTSSELRRIKLFADLTDEDISILNEVIEPVTCRPNQIIVSAGDVGDCMFLVMQGEFRVTLFHRGERHCWPSSRQAIFLVSYACLTRVTGQRMWWRRRRDGCCGFLARRFSSWWRHVRK